MKLFKWEKDKTLNSIVSHKFKEAKKKKRERESSSWGKTEMEVLRERRTSFSLEIRAIRQSAVFGTRRKAALRGGGYAWTPDLRSFDKLLEVVVSPYLGFTLYLSIFQCFGWYEALNGRLIGPKTWDRIDTIFFWSHGAAVTVLGAVWLVNHEICEINHALM